MPAVEFKRNLLLGLLPPATYGRIARQLEPVSLRAGELLFESDSDRSIAAVYFPIDAIVSLDQFVAGKTSSGVSRPSVALTGREGVVGFELFLGGQTAINRATVRVGGDALRMGAQALRSEFGRGTAMQRVLLEAVDALVAQISNNSVCERLHSPTQRLIRWLLLADDRAMPRHLMLTQEALAQFQGVRRESISLAAGRLDRAELITYRRGNLVIVDRAGLQARSCNCYRAIKARYDAMFEPVE